MRHLDHRIIQNYSAAVYHAQRQKDVQLYYIVQLYALCMKTKKQKYISRDVCEVRIRLRICPWPMIPEILLILRASILGGVA